MAKKLTENELMNVTGGISIGELEIDGVVLRCRICKQPYDTSKIITAADGTKLCPNCKKPGV